MALGSRSKVTLRALASGLETSLNDLDVSDNARDPSESVAIATANLNQAAELLHKVYVRLDLPQGAIAEQGYNTRRTLNSGCPTRWAHAQRTKLALIYPLMGGLCAIPGGL